MNIPSFSSRRLTVTTSSTPLPPVLGGATRRGAAGGVSSPPKPSPPGGVPPYAPLLSPVYVEPPHEVVSPLPPAAPLYEPDGAGSDGSEALVVKLLVVLCGAAAVMPLRCPWPLCI